MTNEQLLQSIEQNKKRKEEFIESNKNDWLEVGKQLEERRLEHGMSLREVGERLGTSASRIRRLEKGEPISMAEHLTTCLNMLFDYVELRENLKYFTFYNRELLGFSPMKIGRGRF